MHLTEQTVLTVALIVMIVAVAVALALVGPNLADAFTLRIPR